MIASEPMRSARVVPDTALEKTSSGMPALRMNAQTPFNAASPSTFVLTQM